MPRCLYIILCNTACVAGLFLEVLNCPPNMNDTISILCLLTTSYSCSPEVTPTIIFDHLPYVSLADKFSDMVLLVNMTYPAFMICLPAVHKFSVLML